MMTSNSKLTQAQKQDRKFMLSNLTTQGVVVVTDGVMTIAYRELGDLVEFCTSIMGNGEQKFRRKVGEYYALDRFDHGFTIKVTQDAFNDIMLGFGTH
jgi:hypothetical protein